MISLDVYCKGFATAHESWPPLPLTPSPQVTWWQRFIGPEHDQRFTGLPMLHGLSSVLPQLQLPQVEGISSSPLYQSLVLRGEVANPQSIAAYGPMPQWQQPQELTLWLAPHCCGPTPVLQTSNWSDFQCLLRALAHRAEPVPIAHGVHAQAIHGLIHWGLIHRFGRQTRAGLILLHQAPYGSVPASSVPGGLSDAAWLQASSTLRLHHELTHLATQRVLGEMRLNLLDELVADCMGMVAALGSFHASLFGRCLGIHRPDGRWTTYTKELNPSDQHQVLELVMSRATELEQIIQRNPQLRHSDCTPMLLAWLCRQRLDCPISPPPAGRS